MVMALSLLFSFVGQSMAAFCPLDPAMTCCQKCSVRQTVCYSRKEKNTQAPDFVKKMGCDQSKKKCEDYCEKILEEKKK